MRWQAPLTVLLAWAACTGAGAADWARAPEYDSFHIVLGDDAGADDRFAAELFQKYWKAVTGHEASLGNAPRAGVCVWIGAKGLPDDLAKDLDLQKLGPDGIRIRTEPEQGGAKHLILAGEGERGAMYATFEFLDRYLGVRWLAPDCTCVPAAPPSLPNIDSAHTPVFQHRDSNYFSPWRGSEYEKAHRISANPSYGLYGHTVYTVVPPAQYAVEHPEYYAFIDGKRRAPAGYETWARDDWGVHMPEMGQLCWTNPDLPDIIFNSLADLIRKQPQHKIWNISQMDWANNCQCENCRAVDEKEGTPMGSVLTGLNPVADRVAREFPGYYVETFAYQYTRKPPKHLKPRDNVIIRLCSIECDFGRPLDDPASELNRAFADDIRNWSKLAKTLYIWDYTPNFRSFQTPHPNFHVLQPNLKFFAAHNVKGMFEQGCHEPGGEFGHLRRYIIAKCLWNPDEDAEALLHEFIRLYYEDAAPQIEAYIDLLKKRMLDSGLPMTCFDPIRWLDPATVDQSRALFDQAYAAAKTETLRQRLVEAALPVEFAAITGPAEVKADGASVTVHRSPCMGIEFFLQLAKSFGAREMFDGGSYDRFRTNFDMRVLPRHLSSPIETLENERYSIWVVPAMRGAVLRWRDKQHGLELLDGYRCYSNGPGAFEEWVNTPGVPERPVAEVYRVVSKTGDSLILEAEAPSGLIVRRTMALRPGSDRLELTLTLSNPTSAPVMPGLKIHPEFRAQEKGVPQIWTREGTTWTNATAKCDPNLPAWGNYIARGESTAQAYRMPEHGLTLVNEFEPEEVDALVHFFNHSEGFEQVNLETVLRQEPLAPGESRTLTSVYYVTEKTPESL